MGGSGGQPLTMLMAGRDFGHIEEDIIEEDIIEETLADEDASEATPVEEVYSGHIF